MNKNYKAHGNWFTTSKRKTTKTSKFMRPNKMPLLSLSLSLCFPLLVANTPSIDGFLTEHLMGFPL